MTVCSGIGAPEVSAPWIDWRYQSEIEPFPAAVLAHRFPEAVNLGDMTRFKEWPDANIDVLCGGTPCFPAGTMIATGRGFVPIEKVAVGDMALTHKGRFKRVLRIGSKTSETVEISGQGHFGMVTTKNHPFYARKKSRKTALQNGRSVTVKSVSDPDWVNAESLPGRHWACLSGWPETDWNKPQAIGRERVLDLPDDVLFTLVGTYLGDGWVRMNGCRGDVVFALNEENYTALRPCFDDLPAHSVQEKGKTRRVQISSRSLARWLKHNFGSGAADKKVPMWVLGVQSHLRDSLIRGYQLTDGTKTRTAGVRAVTVSRQLALGMRALAVSTGYASSVRRVVTPDSHVINGRKVRQRDYYTVTFSPSDRSSFQDGLYRWQPVRSVRETGRRECVYNLEVEEDNSYVADGIAVHNCQAFSVAGLRKGLADPRGNLALTYLAIAARYRPRWLVWENVPGVLSSNGGRDFGTFLGALGQLGYGFAYRVLDAQYVRTRRFDRAIPQRRRRIFLVGYLGDWTRAAAVLFDSESLRGNSPPRRETGKEVAGTLSARTQGGGGLGTDFELAGGLIPSHDPCVTLTARDYKGPPPEADLSTVVAHTLRGEGHDASEDGTGRGTPLVPVAIQERAVSENPDAGPDGSGWRQDGAAYTFEARNQPQAVAFDCKGTEVQFSEDGSAPPLRSMGHLNSHQNAGGHAAVAFGVSIRGREDGGTAEIAGAYSPAIRASQGGGDKPHVLVGSDSEWAVRRLTPLECERLMGFPPGWTAIPWPKRNRVKDLAEMVAYWMRTGQGDAIRAGGNVAPDGLRYKALGNSWATNCGEWLFDRIKMVEKWERP